MGKIAWLLRAREGRPTGINNFIKGLGEAILKIDNINEYMILGDNYLHFPVKQEYPVTFPNGSQRYRKMVEMLMSIEHGDILFSFSEPIDSFCIQGRKVFIIHDLIPLIFPEWSSGYARFNESIRRSAQCADLIIAVSEHTKKDIMEYYNIEENKIQVIYEGILNDYKTIYNDTVIEDYALENGYLLSVSTIEPRKNLSGLVQAFVAFRRKHPQSKIKLVLVGQRGWGDAWDSIWSHIGEFAEDIVLTGYVSNEILNGLYRHALGFAYISFYEGFGLPVLEAMNFGKAVICSNTSSLPEVGGDAVLYCNPYDMDSIISVIEKCVFCEGTRKELEKKARVQASKFSYEKAAKEVLQIYQKLI